MKPNAHTSFLADSLKRKVIFFTGKGGVGKTAMAWATALLLSRNHRKVRLVSWSPFDNETIPENLGSLKINWHRLEPAACFKEYTLKTLKFEKIFDVVFENKILKAFIEVAPGLSETVVAGKVWDLYDRAEQDTIVVDLPSTGHALAFFKSPMGIEKMFASGFVHRQAEQICEMFVHPYSRLDVVTLPEEMPLVESGQFLNQLSELGKFPLGYLIVNQCTPDLPTPDTLSKAVPEDIRQCIKDHQKRKEQESLALKAAAHFPLNLIRTPRLTTEMMKNTIVELSEYLEN